RNRNYDAILGLAILVYNLCVIYNDVLNNHPHRKMADIDGCY
ncbi:MAG: IS4/IS5 family transposase, partial [Thermotogae bacterium]